MLYKILLCKSDNNIDFLAMISNALTAYDLLPFYFSGWSHNRWIMCSYLCMYFIFTQVAANGIIVFDSNSSFHLTPQPFPVSGFPYIAPYWFDHSVDIKSTVYYRIIERSHKLTTRASREIRRAFPRAKNFHPSSLVIVTWNIHNPMRNQSNMVIL